MATATKTLKTRHNPGDFLDLPPEACDYGKAAAVILPLPLEESVSYGGGTGRGPAAIIEASRQVELYDIVRKCEPAMEYGVHTLPAPSAFSGQKRDAGKMLEAASAETARHLAAGKFVAGLGGEHTVSLGVAKGVAEIKGDFTLVHIDAHADLRADYQGDPLSHACVVRRIAELPQCRTVLQLGIRSTTREQVAYARERGITTWYARDMHGKKKWKRELRKAVKGERVFFTFDVDGLDPAIVPATGTPEPDGLEWGQWMDIARIVSAHADCVAMDCVELAPAPGLHHADFTVARAVCEMITMFVMKEE